MLSRNPSGFFFLSGLLREVLSPCNSPELCLNEQGRERQVSPAALALLLPSSQLRGAPCWPSPAALALGNTPSPACIPGRSCPAAGPPRQRQDEQGSAPASGMSAEPSSSSSSSSSPPCPGPAPPSSLHLPESRRPRERSPSPLRGYLIPSPLPTRRTRTFSATVRASEGPIYKGVCKCFCRSKGHGFITPADGGPDIFVHISDIEGEYVPVAGDEVTYKMCTIPPKNEKLQAVEVVITHLAPGTKHETWSGHVISS
uniref:Calcium regulated heat stable protein 1 n=1 Tax=Junco hyemalis TaxID=40217 RepID=A0A8C5JSN8_JUNHY